MPIMKQVDIRTVPSNLNREKVMQEIIDVSRIPLPFQSLIGTTSHDNQFFEWSCDRLRDPVLTNRVVDGSTATTPVSAPAVRLGNNSQISQETVGASIRVSTSNTVGNEGLARQIAKSTRQVDQDIDAMLLQNIANRPDDGAASSGQTAGLEAWLDINKAMAGTVAKNPNTAVLTTGTGVAGTIVVGGWTTRTGQIIPAVNYAGLTTTGALSFSQLQQVLAGLWILGVNPTKVMSRSSLIRQLSRFMFTSTAQIATPIRDANEANTGTRVQASVNSMITDFGIVVDFVPNRMQQLSGDGTPAATTLFCFDPQYLQVSWQGGGLRSQELAITGLSKSTQIFGDYGLCVKNPDALGGIVGINEASAVVA